MRQISYAGAWMVSMTALASLSWSAAFGADNAADPHACRDIADPAARLACFDRAVDTPVAAKSSAAPAPASAPASPAPAPRPPAVVATPPADPAPAVPVVAPAAPPLNAEQQFGLPEHTVTVKEVEAGRRAADLKKLEAHVVGITVAPDQRLVFTLDDGQVWRQNASEGELLAKQGDAVTISRGLLGSFWLQLPSGRGCKVSRLH